MIRENPDAVRAAVRGQGINLDVDELLSLDQASRVWLALYEGCQSSITSRGPCQASSGTVQGCLCPGCPCYVAGNALVTLQQAMQYNRKYDLKIAGMDRFYSIRVSGITGRRATVTSCDDARKLMEVDARTGRVVPQTVSPPDKAYLFEIWHMVELSGHWGLASVRPYVEPSPQAELCRSLPDARA